MLAEHRKQLKASQKTTLDRLQREHDVNIENTKQSYRTEVMQPRLLNIRIMKFMSEDDFARSFLVDVYILSIFM